MNRSPYGNGQSFLGQLKQGQKTRFQYGLQARARIAHLKISGLKSRLDGLRNTLDAIDSQVQAASGDATSGSTYSTTDLGTTTPVPAASLPIVMVSSPVSQVNTVGSTYTIQGSVTWNTGSQAIILAWLADSYGNRLTDSSGNPIQAPCPTGFPVPVMTGSPVPYNLTVSLVANSDNYFVVSARDLSNPSTESPLIAVSDIVQGTPSSSPVSSPSSLPALSLVSPVSPVSTSQSQGYPIMLTVNGAAGTNALVRVWLGAGGQASKAINPATNSYTQVSNGEYVSLTGMPITFPINVNLTPNAPNYFVVTATSNPAVNVPSSGGTPIASSETPPIAVGVITHVPLNVVFTMPTTTTSPAYIVQGTLSGASGTQVQVYLWQGQGPGIASKAITSNNTPIQIGAPVSVTLMGPSSPISFGLPVNLTTIGPNYMVLTTTDQFGQNENQPPIVVPTITYSPGGIPAPVTGGQVSLAINPFTTPVPSGATTFAVSGTLTGPSGLQVMMGAYLADNTGKGMLDLYGNLATAQVSPGTVANPQFTLTGSPIPFSFSLSLTPTPTNNFLLRVTDMAMNQQTAMSVVNITAGYYPSVIASPGTNPVQPYSLVVVSPTSSTTTPWPKIPVQVTVNGPSGPQATVSLWTGQGGSPAKATTNGNPNLIIAENVPLSGSPVTITMWPSLSLGSTNFLVATVSDTSGNNSTTPVVVPPIQSSPLTLALTNLSAPVKIAKADQYNIQGTVSGPSGTSVVVYLRKADSNGNLVKDSSNNSITATYNGSGEFITLGASPAPFSLNAKLDTSKTNHYLAVTATDASGQFETPALKVPEISYSTGQSAGDASATLPENKVLYSVFARLGRASLTEKGYPRIAVINEILEDEGKASISSSDRPALYEVYDEWLHNRYRDIVETLEGEREGVREREGGEELEELLREPSDAVLIRVLRSLANDSDALTERRTPKIKVVNAALAKRKYAPATPERIRDVYKLMRDQKDIGDEEEKEIMEPESRSGD